MKKPKGAKHNLLLVHPELQQKTMKRSAFLQQCLPFEEGEKARKYDPRTWDSNYLFKKDQTQTRTL